MSDIPEHDIAEHLAGVPHSAAIGMTFVSSTDSECTLSIPYSPALIGDPDNGVIHGGAITALLDNAAGMIARPKEMHRDVAAIATLDMRIDYMGPATPGQNVYATAHCFKRTTNVAFVRAIAYQKSPDDPIATCTATFMLGTRNAPLTSTNAGKDQV